MNKYEWENKEQFLIDWSNSKNKCNFLKNNNLTATSGNYATLNKWLKIHTQNITQESELSYDKIFIQNSSCNRKHIKNLIEKNKLIPYVCSGCSNNGIWNGKPIKLQLEHKNGISNDHRLENLEYLCPNCHSQTMTYSGKNIHSKVFVERLNDLKKYSLISLENIQELSKKWNINIYSTRSWITKYKEKLNLEKIIIDEKLLLNNSIKVTKERKTIKLIYIQKKNRLKDIELNKNEKNIIQLLSIKWKISRYAVKAWIKRNINDFNQINKNSEIYNKNHIKTNSNKIDFSSRFKDTSLITNKKQVLDLSKKWSTSVNGAKKWIRNNLPDKFNEIYDDKHLIKNQKKVIQQEKVKYIQSLKEDFNEYETMKFLNINKSGLYTQIKAHNPDLLEKLHNKYLCPKCNGKTRSNGNLRRCLICDHSFNQNKLIP